MKKALAAIALVSTGAALMLGVLCTINLLINRQIEEFEGCQNDDDDEDFMAFEE